MMRYPDTEKLGFVQKRNLGSSHQQDRCPVRNRVTRRRELQRRLRTGMKGEDVHSRDII